MLSKSHKYSAEEYRNKQGQFFYKCELTVPGTTWKRSINSRLFSRPSCPKPPEVDGGKYLLSPVKTCWNTPVEGALLTYECDKNHTLSKDGSLVCFEGAWRRFKGHIASFRDVNLNTMEFLSPEDDPFPYCSKYRSTKSEENFLDTQFRDIPVVLFTFLHTTFILLIFKLYQSFPFSLFISFFISLFFPLSHSFPLLH